MVISSWLSFLNPFDGSKKSKKLRKSDNTRQPRLTEAAGEQLETRVLPAANIHVIAGALGTGSQDANLTADGLIAFADPSIGGDTLSTGALMSLAQNQDITIQAGHIDFAGLGGTITLLTGSGHSVTFSTDTAGGNTISFANVNDVLATSGATLTFTAGTDLTIANLNSSGADVSLTAGTQGAGNINAQSINAGATGNLFFQAINGAGGTIMQTGAAAGLAVSATATGDITFDSLRGVSTVSVTSNTGSIGSLGVNGYQANQLNLAAATGIDVITHATASLTATNSTSGDITINQDATSPTALTILSGGVINSAVGGNITVNNNGGTASGASLTVTGPVTANNGDITLGATNGILLSGITADVTTGGGFYVANADLDANGNGTYAQNNVGSAVLTGNGNATITANDVDLIGTIDAGTGIATIQNSFAGTAINLGGVGGLNLTALELDQVTASVIRIGSSSAGLLTNNIIGLNPANTSVLHLIGGSAGMTDLAVGTITETNLAVTSVGNVSLQGNTGMTTFAASITGAASTLTFDYLGAAGFTVGTVDGVIGVTTNDGDVSLFSDDLNITQAINTGTARTTLSTETAFSQDIDVGTDSAGNLGLTDAELNLVTAGVLQIGDANSGSTSVTAAITLVPAQVSTLTLIGNTVDDGGAGTLDVANLRAHATLGSVTLDNGGNDVDSFAARALSAASDVTFNDGDGFVVDTVDGQDGIATNDNANLTSGGAVTQSGTGTISAATLELHGAGPYTLTNVGNDVDTIASDATGATSYTDADGLIIGTVSATNGITTTNAAISVNTVDGALDVNQAVNAGTSTVDLTAGSSATDRVLTINNVITGEAGIVLTGDNMAINSSVGDLLTARVTLQPFEAGTLIDLGGADALNTLGLTAVELALVGTNLATGVVQVGNGTAGNLSNSATITPAGTNQLELVTGAQIIDNFAGPDYVVTRLGMTAGTGIGVSAPNFQIDVTVSNLEATTNTGGIDLFASGAVTVGGVNGTLEGLSVGTSGDINLVAGGTITLSDTDGSETISGGSTSGDIFLTAIGAASDILSDADQDAISAPGGSITLNAGRDILFGTVGVDQSNDVTANNDINFTAGGNITIDGFADVLVDDFGNATGGSVTFNAGGNITVTDANGDSASVGAFGTGDVTLTAGPGQFVTLDIDTFGAVFSDGGDVTVNADRVNLNGGGITANNGIVTLQPVTAAWGVDLGSTTDLAVATLELSDAELDLIHAPTLRINSNGATDINVSGIISNDTNYVDLHLTTLGAVTNSFVGTNLFMTGLAISSGTGVTLETAALTLAINNTAGAISIDNIGALTVGTVDGVVGVTNTGTTTTITAHSPLTIAADVNSAGSVTLTAGEISDAMVFADDLTVNAGVTVHSDADVTLQAGDDIILTAGSTVEGVNVSIVAGFGDLDSHGGLTLDGTITATGTLTISAFDSIALGSLSSGGNMSITSTNGAITDGNDPPDGTLNISAPGVVLSAATGIGGAGVTATIETDVDNLEASTTSGGIFITDLNGSLNIGGVSGATGVSAGGGDIVLEAASDLTVTEPVANTGGGNVTLSSQDSILANEAISTNGAGAITINADTPNGGVGDFISNAAGTVTTAGGDVTITAQDIDLGAAVNAGAGIATLLPRDSADTIHLGTDTAFGLMNADLALITAGIVRIGNASSSTISVDSPIAVPGSPQLELTTGADIQDNNVGFPDITVTRLGLTAQTGIGVGTGGSLISLGFSGTNLEASTATGGIDINTTGAVTIGGVNSALGGLDVTTSGDITLFAQGTISVTDPSGENDNVETPDNIFLTANGVAADIVTGGAEVPSVRSTGTGNIDLVAGRDIVLGTVDGYGDVIAGAGALTMNAVRDVILQNDTFADVSSGTSDINITAGNNVTLQSTFGTDSHIDNDGTGNVNITAGNTFTNDAGGGRVEAGGDVTITADDMVINDPVTSDSGIVTLLTNSPGRTIDLGSNTGGSLGLTDGELDFVDAGTLVIGNGANSGDITVSNAITLSNALVPTLSLATAGAIVDGTAGEQTDITVDNLALRTEDGVGQGDDLDTAVGTVAFDNTVSFDVNISNTGALTIGTVDGLAGGTNLVGDINVTAASPLTVSAPVVGGGIVTLSAGESAAPGDDLTINATVTSTGAGVVLSAGDIVRVNATLSALTGGANVTITGGASDVDNIGGVNLDANIDSGSPSLLQGGNGNDIFNINVVDGVNIPANDLDVNGGGGDDTYNIDFSTGNILGTVDINDNGGTANDVLNVTGANVDENVVYDSNAATPNLTVAGVLVNFAGVDSVSIDAQDLAGDNLFVAEGIPGLCIDEIPIILAAQPTTLPTTIPLTIDNFESLDFEHTPPVISNLAVNNADEGGTANLSVDIFDADNHIGETFLITIDWGDGTIDTDVPFVFTGNTMTYLATHTYADDNPTNTPSDIYAVTVQVEDDNCELSNVLNQNVTVSNVAPVITGTNLPAQPNFAEGQTFSFQGTFTDPGVEDTFVLSINWGDGSPIENVNLPAGSTSFSVDHTWLDDNPTGTNSDLGTISFSLTDDDTGSDSDNAIYLISNVAPVLDSVTLTPSLTENGTATLSGTYTDVGATDTHTLQVDWGDGSPLELFAVAGGTFGGLTHQYLDDDPTGTPADTKSVTVTLLDDDNGIASATRNVVIQNAAPVVSITGNPGTSDEGTTINLGSTESDVGTLDTVVSREWTVTKNGSPYAAGSGAAFSFTPDDNGTYVVTFAVTDDDTGVGTATETITVNNVDPVINSSNLSVAAVNENGSVTLSGTYSDVGTADTHTLTIDWGDGSAPETVAIAGGAFSVNHQYLDDNPTNTSSDLNTITLTVTDDDLGTDGDTQAVTVDNVAPTVSINGAPVSGPEGTSIVLTSTVTDPGTQDTFTYSWSVTKDGNPFASGTNSSLTFTPDDNGTYVVNLTVTDDDTGVGMATAQTISVTNVDPQLNNLDLQPVVIDENGVATLTGTYSDAGSADTHTLTIDWGDGGAPEIVAVSGGAFSITHTYLDDYGAGPINAFNVNVTLTDDDLGTAVSSGAIVVQNVAPVIDSLVLNASISEGGVVTVNGTYHDTGTLDTHTLVINWGDGSTTGPIVVSGGSFGPITHTYVDDNPSGTSSDLYTVTATLTDDDTGTDIETSLVLVNDVAPSVVITGAPVSSPEGTAMILGSTVTDPGLADTFTYAWSVTKDGLPYASGSSTGFTFTPDDNGLYVVTLNVTDDDLLMGSATAAITVTNVNPVLGVLNLTSSTISENGSTTLSGTYTDAGSADTHTLTVNWGDGTADQVQVVSGGTFNLTHQYLDDNPTGTASDVNTISVTVTDDDGGSASSTTSVTVNNVAPTATIVGAPASGNEGTAINLSSTVTDPGTQDTITTAWSVTKNGNPYSSGSGSTFSFTPDDNGTYVVTFTATDDDTGVGTDVETITINNVAPTAGISGPGLVVTGQPVTYTLTATDVSPVDQAANFTFNIDWDGNGSTDQTIVGPSGTQVTHTFADAGAVTVRVTATDKDGGVSAAATLPVTVASTGIVDGVLLVGGTTASDKIFVKQLSNGNIRVTRNGVVLGTFNPTTDGFSSIAVFGYDGNDRIDVTSKLTLPIAEYGGAGNDNLKGGARNDYLDGGDGNDVLSGRNGNDIMVGGAGNDYMDGGANQDFMIGGSGADILYGRGVGDILVGGTTVHDASKPDLENILKEWTTGNTDLNIDSRIANIKAGTGETNGTHLNPAGALVNPGTDAVDDGAVDELHTVQGKNWLITFVTDKLFGSKKYDNANRKN